MEYLNSLMAGGVDKLANFSYGSAVGGNNDMTHLMSGFEDMVNTMIADTSSSSQMIDLENMTLNVDNLDQFKLDDGTSFSDQLAGYKGIDVDAMCAMLESDDPGIPDDVFANMKASTENLTKAFEGLDENSSFDDYLEACLRGCNPDISDEEIEATKAAYAPYKEISDKQQAEKEKRYKECVVKYDDKLEAKDPNVRDYMEFMVDAQFSDEDMSPEDKQKHVDSLVKQYGDMEEKMKKFDEESGLGSDASPKEYITARIKQMYPNLTDKETERLANAFEKRLTKVEANLREMEAETQKDAPDPLETVLKNAEEMVGKRTDAYYGDSIDDQYKAIEERMLISQASNVNSKYDKWDTGFAMSLMVNGQMLDISELGKKYGDKYDLTKYNDAINWAKDEKIWNDAGDYSPKAGDVIMLGNDHSGVVTKVEDGKIYTVEGDVGNAVVESSYDMDDEGIVGYIDCQSQPKSWEKEQ